MDNFAFISSKSSGTPSQLPVPVSEGGTGATDTSNARTNLGLVIGTDVLAPNGSAASLTSFPTLNQNTTGTASNVTGIVAVVNGGTGATDNTSARANLGLGTMSLQNDSSVAITGGAIANIPYNTWSVVRVSSPFTTTNLTYTDITGLSVNLDANSIYVINMHLFTGSSSSAGLQCGATFPAGATITFEGRGVTTTSTASTLFQYTSSGVLFATAFNTVVAQVGQLQGGGVVTTSSTSGVLKIGVGKVTSGTATIRTGSYLSVLKVL